VTLVVVIIVVVAFFAYVGLRTAPALIGWYDRALRNSRERPAAAYLLPVYARRDLSAKWPGWDGWYGLLIPRDKNLPVNAIRASIMTGLYGLDGIDNYAKLGGLSAFHAVEYLTMVQTNDTSHLFQQYLPKGTDLAIRQEQLLVSVKDWGQISGQWPHYHVEMRDPPGGIEFSLTYAGKHLIWWADLPHLFTYFAVFGEVQGTITIKGREYPIGGLGTFEHGFARKPFNFDALLKPLRVLRKVVPFTLIHYHYNILIGEDGSHGGMMLAQGLGSDFRNLGGMYLGDERFKRLDQIEIVYAEMERVASPGFDDPVACPKVWIVRARADEGTLEYRGTRESPPALIAQNMVYIDFRFTATYREPGKPDQAFVGHGYGEYVAM
jgi:hypothetical protein